MQKLFNLVCRGHLICTSPNQFVLSKTQTFLIKKIFTKLRSCTMCSPGPNMAKGSGPSIRPCQIQSTLICLGKSDHVVARSSRTNSWDVAVMAGFYQGGQHGQIQLLIRLRTVRPRSDFATVYYCSIYFKNAKPACELLLTWNPHAATPILSFILLHVSLYTSCNLF